MTPKDHPANTAPDWDSAVEHPVADDPSMARLGPNSSAKWLLAVLQHHCWVVANSQTLPLEAVKDLCRVHQVPESAIAALLEPRDAKGGALFLEDAGANVRLADHWWAGDHY